ncbi:hypothetical protein [Actinoplanes sp. NPDC026670]|uniref:hypothetical protein n=1 Tax=Actinoplanes sp. NPDC026670 TaxID=3154700 RepID=UPI0033C6F822
MVLRLKPETLATFTDAQIETLTFVEQMTGWEITDEVDESSPAGQMVKLTEALKADLITAEEYRAAMARVMGA